MAAVNELRLLHTELASGVSSTSRDRRDSRGSRGESDDDSTDLDDENYHEVNNDGLFCRLFNSSVFIVVISVKPSTHHPYQRDTTVVELSRLSVGGVYTVCN